MKKLQRELWLIWKTFYPFKIFKRITYETIKFSKNVIK